MIKENMATALQSATRTRQIPFVKTQSSMFMKTQSSMLNIKLVEGSLNDRLTVLFIIECLGSSRFYVSVS